jgi:hypothetical protein
MLTYADTQVEDDEYDSNAEISDYPLTDPDSFNRGTFVPVMQALLYQ